MDISKTDKNFAVACTFEKEDIEYRNIDEKPFQVYGIFKEKGKYRRIPEELAKRVSDGVYMLHTNTALIIGIKRHSFRILK